MIEQGRLAEEEAEHLFVQSLQHLENEEGQKFKSRIEGKTKLDTKDLVQALNEQVELRDAGNRLYSRA